MSRDPFRQLARQRMSNMSTNDYEFTTLTLAYHKELLSKRLLRRNSGCNQVKRILQIRWAHWHIAVPYPTINLMMRKVER